MKARNPSTGTLDTVYVKALDSMPAGTEVDFDGSVADIPAGWEQVNNVLYSDNTGTNTDVSLSDSVSNYSYLEITFTRSSKDTFNCIKVGTNSSFITLEIQNIANNNEVYFSVAKYSLSGSSITLSKFKDYYQSANGQSWNANTSSSSSVYITKVVGIK